MLCPFFELFGILGFFLAPKRSDGFLCFPLHLRDDLGIENSQRIFLSESPKSMRGNDKKVPMTLAVFLLDPSGGAGPLPIVSGKEGQ